MSSTGVIVCDWTMIELRMFGWTRLVSSPKLYVNDCAIFISIYFIYQYLVLYQYLIFIYLNLDLNQSFVSSSTPALSFPTIDVNLTLFAYD